MPESKGIWMKIEQLMTKEVRTCPPESGLNEAARIMWEHDCGCVPIVAADRSGRLAGILTDRDVCMAAYTQGKPLAEIRASEVMSDEVVTCQPTTTLELRFCTATASRTDEGCSR